MLTVLEYIVRIMCELLMENNSRESSNPRVLRTRPVPRTEFQPTKHILPFIGEQGPVYWCGRTDSAVDGGVLFAIVFGYA